MKLWRNSCLVFFLFFFFCLSAFFFVDFFFFSSFRMLFFFFFFVLFFDLYLRELSPMMSNKQTNKKKIQSYQLALHSLKRGFFGGRRGWNGELSSKQLDEHRRGVKEEEEEEGQYKVHDVGGGGGVKVQKVQEDRGWLRS